MIVPNKIIIKQIFHFKNINFKTLLRHQIRQPFFSPNSEIVSIFIHKIVTFLPSGTWWYVGKTSELSLVIFPAS